ncbi:MAG TPA: HAMP domain-containing sensor histidine kinase, partial [Azospira sp.]|nr:HAMP domain-containing sensor histidine kinase [Azospira sp.]
RLVDQLLTLARLDAQEELPGQESCPLRRLAVETVAALAPAGFDKGVELEVEEGPEVSVAGSPLLLQVLLRNLLDNAIRYTPAGGRVLVRCQVDAGGATLHVCDSGPGIAVEQRQEALARFRRLDPGAGEGHGLGLSIVARITELHGAALQLDTAQELGGLDVAVVFPAPIA